MLFLYDFWNVVILFHTIVENGANIGVYFRSGNETKKTEKKNQTLIYKQKNITKITTTKMEKILNNECNISWKPFKYTHSLAPHIKVMRRRFIHATDVDICWLSAIAVMVRVFCLHRQYGSLKFYATKKAIVIFSAHKSTNAAWSQASAIAPVFFQALLHVLFIKSSLGKCGANS